MRDDDVNLPKSRAWLAAGLASVWVIWQMWIAATVPPEPVLMRAVHLAFAFSVAFLLVPGYLSRRAPRVGFGLDIVLALAATIALVHLILNFATPDFTRVVAPWTIDIVLALVMITLVLVGLIRVTGLPLAITVGVFLGYALLGQYIPGAAGHGGFSIERILSILYLQLDGLLGSTTGASATMIFPVLVFGGMLVALGGGTFFTEFSLATLGRFRGAAGKVAVIASALFGSVAGTGGAGVATTGVFTIPLMKKTGYKGEQAAGIEASASVGGQVLPPVMGAAAFVMVEFISLPYSRIVTHALIPALLYFLTVFYLVHLEARRNDLRPLDRDELPKLKPVLISGGHFLVPLVVLVSLIAVWQMSVGRAALYATVVMLVLEFISRIVRGKPLELRRLVDGVIEAARTAVIVAIAVAGIQLVVGVVGLTGLGVKLSSLLLALAGDSALALLFLTALAAILLGLGLPTLPTYMVLAILVAPALIEYGIPDIAAHFFIFYFGVFSGLTPPTALASTVAAGIARTPLLRTMLTSMRYGLLGLVLPFMFVYSPALLMIGSAGEIAFAVVKALVGIVIVGSGLAGFDFRHMGPIWRALIVAAGIAVISPIPVLAITGVLSATVIYAIRYFSRTGDKPLTTND